MVLGSAVLAIESAAEIILWASDTGVVSLWAGPQVIVVSSPSSVVLGVDVVLLPEFEFQSDLAESASALLDAATEKMASISLLGEDVASVPVLASGVEVVGSALVLSTVVALVVPTLVASASVSSVSLFDEASSLSASPAFVSEVAVDSVAASVAIDVVKSVGGEPLIEDV